MKDVDRTNKVCNMMLAFETYLEFSLPLVSFLFGPLELPLEVLGLDVNLSKSV